MHLLIPLSEAFNLLAVGPALFLAMLLPLVSEDRRMAIVPAGYFLFLSGHFIAPVLSVLGLDETSDAVRLVSAALSPAFCYLLVLQLADRRMPKPISWAIIAVPAGIAAIIASSLARRGGCIGGGCIGDEPATLLVHVFVVAVVLLLLIARLSHRTAEGRPELPGTTSRLIQALIVLQLAAAAIELAALADWIPLHRATDAVLVLRIGFIYLVLTLLFRLRGEGITVDRERVPTMVPKPAADETRLAERLVTAMEADRLYRTAGLTRESLARKAGMSEQTASRLLNQHFGKNFNEFVNGYRVREAKSLLTKGGLSVQSVANESGFASIASFNRVFKNETGLAPTAWRDGQAQPLSESP